MPTNPFHPFNLTNDELDALDAAAQGVVDSHTPPTEAAKAAAYATIGDCRIERNNRAAAYSALVEEYRAGDRSPRLLAALRGR